MKKDTAIIMLNNLKEDIKMVGCFRKQETICRNIEKVSRGIEFGFD